MDIIEALKQEDIRVSNVRRWLVWCESVKAWVVYEHAYAKRTEQLVVTEDEEEAIKWLLYQEAA